MASPYLGTTAKSVAIGVPAFQRDRFIVKRKTFSFTPQFWLVDQEGNTLAFLRKKVFSWKDEIRLFTDESQTMELLNIKARKIIDWGMAFDITDAINHQKVGMLKRREWKSLVRGEWTILDAGDLEIGRVQEDSAWWTTIRRYLTNIIPQRYIFEVGGQVAGTARQNWNFFAPKMEVDFAPDPGRLLDRRLCVAAVVLLMITLV